MRRLACLLLCLWVSPVWAQITVPQRVEPHTPIVASVDTSSAATGSVQVLWEAGAGVSVLPVGDGSTVHVWAPPGVHSLRCDVFRVDWESKQFKVERHNAQFTVGTPPQPDPQPEPVPPPQPVPVGKLTAVVLHESEDDSPAFARMAVALRSGSAATWIKEQGHKLLILDDDTVDADGQPIKLVATLKQLGVQMPALFVLDAADKVVLKQTLADSTTADNVVEYLRRIRQ